MLLVTIWLLNLELFAFGFFGSKRQLPTPELSRGQAATESLSTQHCGRVQSLILVDKKLSLPYSSETTEKERQDLGNHPFFDAHLGCDPAL
jgi:hypothetical protein